MPEHQQVAFFYRGIGLMLAFGFLDCAVVVYMVVGHIKFGPDLVARQISGRYSVEDAFNHRMLVNIIRPYASAGAYDDTLFQAWKRGTQDLLSRLQVSCRAGASCCSLLGNGSKWARKTDWLRAPRLRLHTSNGIANAPAAVKK